MTLTSSEALWFLPFATPIVLWAAYTDLKYMKILNVTAGALALVFLIVGMIIVLFDDILTFQDYLWRLLHLVVVLVIGFVLNLIRLIGGGDAKLMAAIAPFVALPDALRFIFMLAGILIVAFILHRIGSRIGFVRRATPDWKSWDHLAFPMGTALAGALITYLTTAIISGI